MLVEVVDQLHELKGMGFTTVRQGRLTARGVLGEYHNRHEVGLVVSGDQLADLIHCLNMGQLVYPFEHLIDFFKKNFCFY
jgi:hypothetical protein